MEILSLVSLFLILLAALMIAWRIYIRVKSKTPYALTIAILTFVIVFAVIAFLALLVVWFFAFER